MCTIWISWESSSFFWTSFICVQNMYDGRICITKHISEMCNALWKYLLNSTQGSNNGGSCRNREWEWETKGKLILFKLFIVCQMRFLHHHQLHYTMHIWDHHHIVALSTAVCIIFIFSLTNSSDISTAY